MQGVRASQGDPFPDGLGSSDQYKYGGTPSRGVLPGTHSEISRRRIRFRLNRVGPRLKRLPEQDNVGYRDSARQELGSSPLKRIYILSMRDNDGYRDSVGQKIGASHRIRPIPPSFLSLALMPHRVTCPLPSIWDCLWMEHQRTLS